MTTCDLRSENHFKVAFLFTAAGLGALVSLALGFAFVYKWLVYLEANYRQKVIPRLIFAIVGVFTVQHQLRFVLVICYYYAPRWAALVVFHITSLFLVSMFCLLFTLLVVELESTFKNSLHAVSVRQTRFLYLLIGIDTFGVIGHQILSDLVITYPSHYMRGALVTLTAILLILGLMILSIVDLGFIWRIQSLVSCRASMDQTEDVASSPAARVGRVATLSEIRRASISEYDATNQSLLKTAARSAVIAIWISLSFVMIGTAAIFLALSDSCANWPHIIAYILSTIVYPMIVLPISFSMPHFEYEYQLCCHHCDTLISKLVAFETNQQTLQLSHMVSNSNTR